MKSLICLCIILSKIFDTTGNTLISRWFVLSKRVILLIDWCNISQFQILKQLTLFDWIVNSLCKAFVETLENLFKILGVILLVVVAFLRLMLLISFFISHISTVSNEKIRWFFTCFCIKRILGWNLYFSLYLDQ